MFHTFFIGDEAFPLSENLVKVYLGEHPKDSKERIFNYRICRSRRVVENVFGLSSSVFRVLHKPMVLEPEKAQLIYNDYCLLTQFLKQKP